MTAELKDSQATLSTYFGLPITNFAAPYGRYNDQVTAGIKTYYQSHRTTENDFNGKDNFDPYRIRAFEIDSNVDANYVKALVDKAVRDKIWLVILYHHCAPTKTSDDYSVTTADLDATLSYLKTQNVPVVTVNQALSEINAQTTTPPAPPVANFSTNVSEGFAPLSVQFTDLSKNTTGRNWNFGDGANSTEQKSNTYLTLQRETTQ